MLLVETGGDFGTVESGGVRKKIGLHLLDEPKVGGYVIVHAGFAIEELDEERAMETLALLEELAASLPEDNTG